MMMILLLMLLPYFAAVTLLLFAISMPLDGNIAALLRFDF